MRKIDTRDGKGKSRRIGASALAFTQVWNPGHDAHADRTQVVGWAGERAMTRDRRKVCGIRGRALVATLIVAFTAGCGGASRPLWHEQKLPSGRTVKVTSFNLVWGVEHDERNAAADCLALEYVSADPNADPARRQTEAMEVFELIRPTSEQWGLPTATLAAFPSVERKGKYDLYQLVRKPDGSWAVTHTDRKVFATD
jgi:hypothetical protein